MSSLKIEPGNLHQIPTFFEPKNRAGDVAGDVPMTCRCRAGGDAGDVDGDVHLSKRPENDLFAPKDMLGCLENIAPQKRS
ncbi:MAG: hypothetical protein H8E28_14630 [Anaerolineae bacterium]|nr:hypothetical protein [Anaerolineae bacterium]